MSNQIALALFSGFLGFTLSQLFNLAEYVLRPRFRNSHFEHGVISADFGDPPETPWEIELGFYVKNVGRRPARNTRVFVSELSSLAGSGVEFELTSFNFCELRRPSDIIPPGEAVLVRFGRINSETHSLKIASEKLGDDDDELLDADTREKVAFLAKIHIICDDKSSAKVLNLYFRPDKDQHASYLIADHQERPLPMRPK